MFTRLKEIGDVEQDRLFSSRTTNDWYLMLANSRNTTDNECYSSLNTGTLDNMVKGVKTKQLVKIGFSSEVTLHLG